ncbi:MAG: hypothetical protein SCM11_07925 [Bacillota bacterium]|nr:hypothetical protein [Bacillota bacterium]
MSLFHGNRSLIEQARSLYVLIRRQEGITRQMLSEQLDMPATSLNRALDRQLQLGLIEEYGFADSTGGRRPGLYRIVSQAYYLFGLDLSGAAGHLALQVVEQIDLPGIDLLLEEGLGDVICRSCRVILDRQGISADKLLGLGVGWSAPVVHAAEASGADVDVPGLKDGIPDHESRPGEHTALSPVFADISAALGIPVFSLRGADAALYAGLWQQNSLADGTFLYLSAGRSIRYAMAVRGQLHVTGLTTDSIGDLVVPWSMHPEGQRLDQVATIPAMVRRFRKSKNDKTLDWSDFCLAAAAGKKKAGSIVTEAAQCMALSIQNMTILTGGRYLLLGGQALFDLPAYESAIRHELASLAKSGARIPLLMDLAYGNCILAVGASAYVLEMSLGQA